MVNTRRSFVSRFEERVQIAPERSSTHNAKTSTATRQRSETTDTDRQTENYSILPVIRGSDLRLNNSGRHGALLLLSQENVSISGMAKPHAAKTATKTSERESSDQDHHNLFGAAAKTQTITETREQRDQDRSNHSYRIF